ncbi:MAG TPA: hypothetical protein PK831_02775 [Candidatus Magasanikbacteria bacterium]|jgi:hypothetical protein|nr:hypothetical protein [Candidatus Magasanikbacteria bacterium]HQF57401.1 hypothetical protein [Candidatus Magasanikbacteria bacterium]HQL52651.1 hypothetical protein [Candidatus Magasanikbacteria bacterium]
MFEISLYIFLFIYFGFLAIFFIFSILNFYHIVVTASFTLASFIVSFFVFSLATLILYATWYLLINVDWQTAVPLFNYEWFNGILIF